MRYRQACLEAPAINELPDDENTASFLIRLDDEFPIHRSDVENCSCSFDFEISDGNIARFGNTRHYNLFMYNLLLCPIETLTTSAPDEVRKELVMRSLGLFYRLPWLKETTLLKDYRRHVEDVWQRLQASTSEQIRDIWTQHKKLAHDIIFKELRVGSIQIGDRITFTPNDTVEFEVSQA